MIKLAPRILFYTEPNRHYQQAYKPQVTAIDSPAEPGMLNF